ncbi:hypothetical protein Tco_0133932 [Tanacetum coccineum]
MKDAISLMGRSESVFRMTTNEMYRPPSEPSRQEEFEHIVMNFILDQEERVKQLEEYMRVIINDFMQLSLKVMRRDKSLIYGGMLVTKIARLFGLLTGELRDALSIEPPPHVFKKKSLITMGVIMELQNEMCVWPALRAVEEEEEAEEEAERDEGHDGAGGSTAMYQNISQVLSSDLTNKISYRKFLIKDEEEIFTDAGDGVRIYPNGVASPAM